MNMLNRINDALLKGVALALAFSFSLGCNGNTVQTIKMINEPAPMGMTTSANTIRLALLLDTSSSMNGLIDQAKAQLWVIVNELGKARSNGQVPNLQIALYEYGNDGLSAKNYWIRQITKFTSDLDTVSEQLFSLKTNGGEEYCGAVIGRSLSDLTWSTLTSDLEMIVIAGNEPFTQGPIDYKISCATAKDKHVFINTIFCGDPEEGLKTGWKDGGDCSGGSSMCINMNKKTIYVKTPYDDAIVALNDSLNKTYIPFGSLGYVKQNSQVTEDANAGIYTSANTVNRTNTKISSNYKNESWDLVDATDYKTADVTKLKEEDLPKEMKGMTKEQRVEYVEKKKNEREYVKQRVKTVNAQREKYIAEHQLKEDKDQRLDAVLIEAIHQQGAKRGFTFEK